MFTQILSRSVIRYFGCSCLAFSARTNREGGAQVNAIRTHGACKMVRCDPLKVAIAGLGVLVGPVFPPFKVRRRKRIPGTSYVFQRQVGLNTVYPWSVPCHILCQDIFLGPLAKDKLALVLHHWSVSNVVVSLRTRAWANGVERVLRV